MRSPSLNRWSSVSDINRENEELACKAYPSSPSIRSEQPQHFDCPRCQSSDTRSFEMAYAMNTTTAQTGAIGYTLGVGPTVAKAKTTGQTGLASRIAPPTNPGLGAGRSIAIAFASALIVGSVVGQSAAGGTVGFWLGVLVFIATFVIMAKYENGQTEEYNQKLEKWRHSWICMRCGSTWSL